MLDLDSRRKFMIMSGCKDKEMAEFSINEWYIEFVLSRIKIREIHGG